MEKQFIKIHISEYDKMKVVYMEEPELTIDQTFDLSGDIENKTRSFDIRFETKEFDIAWNGTKVDRNFTWNNFIASFLINNIKEFAHIQGVEKNPAYKMHHNYASPYTANPYNHLPVLSPAERDVFETVHRQIYELFHKVRRSMDAIVYISPTTEKENENLIGMIRTLHNVSVLYNEYLPLDEIFITMAPENSDSSNFIGFQYTRQSTNETFVLIDSPVDKEKALEHYCRIKF